MGKRKTTYQFIVEARKVHGDKYDYSKVEYINAYTKVCIICPIHGEFWQIPTDHLNGCGCTMCLRISNGVGVCDIKNVYGLQSLNQWHKMFHRCYNIKYQEKHPSYIGCQVCDEWHLFSNFKKWHDEHYIKGYDLDKDILVKNNKVYSPNTCCFVPHEINTFLTRRQNQRGDYPIGVYKCGDKYHSHFCKHQQRIYLGSFNTPQEAFYAYKNAKERYIQEIAEKYFHEGKITKKVYNALMNYTVEMND